MGRIVEEREDERNKKREREKEKGSQVGREGKENGKTEISREKWEREKTGRRELKGSWGKKKERKG